MTTVSSISIKKLPMEESCLFTFLYYTRDVDLTTFEILSESAIVFNNLIQTTHNKEGCVIYNSHSLRRLLRLVDTYYTIKKIITAAI